jgi:leucyl aminopeptidase
MMLHLKSADLKKKKIDILAVPVCEDKQLHKDLALKGIIDQALKLDEFSGKQDESVILYDPPGMMARRVMLTGVGEYEKLDRETLRKMAGGAVKSCIAKELGTLWIALPEADGMNLEPSDGITALLEGAYLGNHVFQKYKGDKKKKTLRQINFLTSRRTARKFKHLCSKVAAVCDGTQLAREWISTPANDKTPEKFARSIVGLARKERLKVQVINEAQLKQQKFGAMLAVAAGSQSKPSLVILQHRVPGAQKNVALVGKGVTFDSGGLNIKTGGYMADMKSDMSGAAAVAATLITAARLKLKVNLIGAIPIVENMVSGRATRPGDIVKSYTGKTVEIGNTDAEGRLILIDAMAYTIKKYKPQITIDLATLTGACVVALGDQIAGVFSDDDELAEAISAAGDATHERCWRLPLPADYKELLKSDFADINNMPSSRYGGAITAALFLSEFVEKTRWAHIDIAGPAYAKKDNAYCGPGGTGFGVRLLMEVLKRI